MRHYPRYDPKAPVTLPTVRTPLTYAQRRSQADEFWTDYFTRYPQEGGNSEMNYLRAIYLPRIRAELLKP